MKYAAKPFASKEDLRKHEKTHKLEEKKDGRSNSKS